MALEISSFTSPLSVSLGGLALTTIPSLSIPVANSANVYTTVTPGAGQSIRINAGNTAWEAFTPSAGGTVNSVGLTVNSTSPSGIFTVSGSPVTTSGTLDIAIAGTSGGVPYFSSSTVISSSGALTLNSPVLGGGAGAAPKVVAGITSDGTSKITLGVAGASVGSIGFNNATSGTITLAPTTGALGTVTQTLQAVTGTIYCTGGTDVAVADGGTGLSAIAALSLLVANSANVYVALTPGAGNSIRINAGGTAWEAFTPAAGTVTSVSFTGGIVSVATATTTPALTVAGTSGGVVYFSSSSAWASSALLAANSPILGGGAGAAPKTSTAILSDGAAAVTLGLAGTATGSLNLAGTTSGTVTVTVAGAAGTWTLTLPTTDGNANEFLQTNGSGVTTWAAGNAGTVTSVSGTTNRITSTGGATPVIDISAAYVGQTSITTLGTVTTGTLSTGAVIGGVTMTLGSDATGDVYYRNSSGVLTRIAAGAQNTILTMGASSVPAWAAPATSGTVTSVAQSFTGGLISVAGSPITTSGTLALTVAGTSGGVVYFSSSSAWASSALLASGGVVIGGGAGGAPFTDSDLTFAADTLTVTKLQCSTFNPNSGSTIFTLPSADILKFTNNANTLVLLQLNDAGTIVLNSAASTNITLRPGADGFVQIGATSITGSGNNPGLLIIPTWNTTGAPTALKVNVTNTASDAASLLFDLQVGAVSQYRVSKAGNSVQLGTITAGSSATVLTDAAGKILSAALNTVAVANGGLFLTSIAALSIPVANSSNVYTTITPAAGQSIRINAGNTAWEAYTPGTGTVTSVAQSFTGGLISVAGSPITSSGTLALTVAGTSGGVVYFSSSSAWASSALLAANAILIGGGAGAAPASTTTATGILTWIGTPSSANLLAAMTDETGTGVLVFGTSPTFTTSIITGSTTFALINTTATTINFAGAATTINIGTSATVLNFGGGATAAEFRFLEPSGSGTNYTAFKAVAQTANITYSLPPTVGAAGTQLTDVAGDGVLTWAAAGGGGAPGGSNKQIQFNNSSAFNGAAGFEYQSGSSPNVSITAQNAAHVGLYINSAASPSQPPFKVALNGTQGMIFDTDGFLAFPHTKGIKADGTGQVLLLKASIGTVNLSAYSIGLQFEGSGGFILSMNNRGTINIVADPVTEAGYPPLSIAGTWNASGVTHNGILLNITNTASAAASKLLDLQVGGASKLTVNKTGNLGIAGSATTTSPLNVTGLPTSAAGLATGDVWSNSGVLTIV